MKPVCLAMPSLCIQTNSTYQNSSSDAITAGKEISGISLISSMKSKGHLRWTSKIKTSHIIKNSIQSWLTKHTFGWLPPIILPSSVIPLVFWATAFSLLEAICRSVRTCQAAHVDYPKKSHNRNIRTSKYLFLSQMHTIQRLQLVKSYPTYL